MGKLQVEGRATQIDPAGRKCAGDCGNFKSWTKYYKIESGLNGRSAKCRECTKADKKGTPRATGVKGIQVSNLITDVDKWWDGVRIQDVCLGRVL